jgi:hypothetical protein
MTENWRVKMARLLGDADFPSLPFFGATSALALTGRDLGDEHLLAAEHGDDRVDRVANALTRHGFAGSGPAAESKSGHC